MTEEIKCCTAVMLVPEGRTEDGFETHFATNYLGHSLLTRFCWTPWCILGRMARARGSSAPHPPHTTPPTPVCRTFSTYSG
ncbi:hypothetical protein Q8A67_006429 [Cirrhinus molitorella]|uniref:Uncharacterized protein n=1 Tax=Cirrhinus molitorella TaxID=172907 RepID=A0AA88TRS6_9TELE|nr:hypothetical protein Q8A67_006429 [Cirrhinus molitorella]